MDVIVLLLYPSSLPAAAPDGARPSCRIMLMLSELN